MLDLLIALPPLPLLGILAEANSLVEHRSGGQCPVDRSGGLTARPSNRFDGPVVGVRRGMNPEGLDEAVPRLEQDAEHPPAGGVSGQDARGWRDRVSNLTADMTQSLGSPSQAQPSKAHN